MPQARTPPMRYYACKQKTTSTKNGPPTRFLETPELCQIDTNILVKLTLNGATLKCQFIA